MGVFWDQICEYRLNMAFLQTWSTKKYSYNNQARLDHGFLYVLKGHITYTFDGDAVELYGGDIIYLPKGSYYEAEFDISNGEVSDYLINFDETDGGNKTVGNKPCLIYKDVNGGIVDYFRKVVESFGKNDEPFLTRSLFYLLLHTIFTVCDDRGEIEDSYVRKGAELLGERCDMSVDEIAKALHLSRSAFQKRFKESFGVSPVKYRTQKRLEKAKLYLDTTDMPIKEIADKLLFYDLSYFYKVFEKEFGIPPKAYRESLKRYL